MIQFSSLFLNRLENVHTVATDRLKYVTLSPSRNKDPKTPEESPVITSTPNTAKSPIFLVSSRNAPPVA